jgi:hypothetical protein
MRVPVSDYNALFKTHVGKVVSDLDISADIPYSATRKFLLQKLYRHARARGSVVG